MDPHVVGAKPFDDVERVLWSTLSDILERAPHKTL